MISYPLSVLKKEMGNITSDDLTEICLRMAKFKKENKELLCYLLFDSNYEPEYIERVKNEIDILFNQYKPVIFYQKERS
jgi:hypothetical protein